MSTIEYERIRRLNKQIEQIKAVPILYIPSEAARESCILTNRKVEYLALVSFGLNNGEIAYVLLVTESTVKQTLGDIYYKLNALDRANAVNIAWVHNILNTYIITTIIKRYENRIQDMMNNYSEIFDKRKKDIDN